MRTSRVCAPERAPLTLHIARPAARHKVAEGVGRWDTRRTRCRRAARAPSTLTPTEARPVLWRESLVPAVYPERGAVTGRSLMIDMSEPAVAARRAADMQRALHATMPICNARMRAPTAGTAGATPPHSGTTPGLSAACSTVRPAAAAARARARAARATLVTPAPARLGGTMVGSLLG